MKKLSPPLVAYVAFTLLIIGLCQSQAGWLGADHFYLITISGSNLAPISKGKPTINGEWAAYINYKTLKEATIRTDTIVSVKDLGTEAELEAWMSNRHAIFEQSQREEGEKQKERERIYSAAIQRWIDGGSRGPAPKPPAGWPVP